MFTFTVTPDDGEPYKLVAKHRDVLKWERAGKGTLNGFRENPSLMAISEIAHIAARRQQMFTGTLQEFEDSVDLDFEGDEEPDPTQEDR